MKKVLLFAIIASMVICMSGCSDEDAFRKDPERVAQGAWISIHGFGDAEMFMFFTPINEGTETYNTVYSTVTDYIRDATWSDSYKLVGYVDVKSFNKDLFDEYVEYLSSYGITGVTDLREYIYVNQWNGISLATVEESGFYVAKIGKKWYVVDVAN